MQTAAPHPQQPRPVAPTLTPQQAAAYQSYFIRQQHQQQHPHQQIPQQQLLQQQQHHQQQQQQALIAQAFQQHASQGHSNAPQQIYQEFMRMAMLEDWYLEGAHKNRLLLSISSSLPNEVDWAFNKLVVLSFLAPDYFVLNMIPSLIESILDHAMPYFAYMTSTVLPARDPNAIMPVDLYNVVFQNDPLDQELMERVLQIYHIFRNFSFVDANIPILVSSQDILKMVSFGIRATGFVKSTEIRLYALDMLENLSVHIKLNEHDPILGELKNMLFDQDRAIVLGSMRTLSRLVHLEHNEPVFQKVDPRVIQRLLQLLFVWDEELVATVMDLLYHYTCLYGSVTAKIASSIPTNIVKILLKFLEWRQHTRPQPKPHLGIDPRTYCLEWLRNTYELDQNHAINQATVFEEYVKYCQEKKIQAISLNELLRLAFHLFPGTSSLVQEQVVCVKGLKPKSVPVVIKPPAADTSSTTPTNVPQEESQGESQEEDKNVDVMDVDGDATSEQTKPSNNPSNNPSPAPVQRQQQQKPAQPTPQRPIPQIAVLNNQQEMSSIPLTTALILRNLAQSKSNRSLFLPYEADIAGYAARRNIHESVSRVLANILYELGKPEK